MKWLVLLIGVLAISSPFVWGDGEAEAEDDGKVEEEADEAGGKDKAAEADVTASEKDLDEEEEAKPIQPSPDAEAYVLFTKPVGTKDFPGGKPVRLLVGLLNKGQVEFTIESVDAAFRYPMDYSFYLRNYTSATYNRVLAPGLEGTFDYAFVPPEDLAGRPFGLTVNINYKDNNGTYFQNAVFNETVNIIEDETGFNPETGFLYLFFGCVVVLLLVLGQHFLQKMRRKHGMVKKSAPVEMGTSNNPDVDWEWIPKEVLGYANKSPKPGSPKRSPRQRKEKKGGGSSDDE